MAQRRPRIRTTPDTFFLEVPRLRPIARTVVGGIMFFGIIFLIVLDLRGFFSPDIPQYLGAALFTIAAFLIGGRILWLHTTSLQVEGDRSNMTLTLGPFSRTHAVRTDELIIRRDLRQAGGTETPRIESVLAVEIGAKSYTRMVGRPKETIEQVVEEWEKWRG